MSEHPLECECAACEEELLAQVAGPDLVGYAMRAAKEAREVEARLPHGIRREQAVASAEYFEGRVRELQKRSGWQVS